MKIVVYKLAKRLSPLILGMTCCQDHCMVSRSSDLANDCCGKPFARKDHLEAGYGLTGSHGPP